MCSVPTVNAVGYLLINSRANVGPLKEHIGFGNLLLKLSVMVKLLLLNPFAILSKIAFLGMYSLTLSV